MGPTHTTALLKQRWNTVPLGTRCGFCHLFVLFYVLKLCLGFSLHRFSRSTPLGCDTVVTHCPWLLKRQHPGIAPFSGCGCSGSNTSRLEHCGCSRTIDQVANCLSFFFFALLPLLMSHRTDLSTTPHRIPMICPFIQFDRVMGD